MSNTQLFFALAGMFVSVIVAQTLLLNSRISDLAQSIERLIDNFTNHFHTADELHGFTDPPIIPKGEAE
jgi:hypothetical protein